MSQSPPSGWLPPGAFAAPNAPYVPPNSEGSLPRSGAAASAVAHGWERRDRWLLLLATLTICLAVLVFTGGFQYARATYRFEQAPPGMAYGREGTTARVLSIVAAPMVRTGSSGKDEAAPRGTVYVVATIELSGTPDGLCSGKLVLSDGRTFNETYLNKPDRTSCLDLEKQPVVQIGLYYVVPEASVSTIVGVAMDPQIGLARTTVLRPPS